MIDRPQIRTRETFQDETRRMMAGRVPLGVGFCVVLAAVAGLLERFYFPERASALLASFLLEVGLCLTAVAIARSRTLRYAVIPLAVAATLGVALLVTAYVVAVAASGDALAFALIIFLTGVALLLPWGLAGQVPLAIGIVTAYVFALAAGVRGELPAPYGILSVAGGAVTSVLGAYFLDQHRRAIFAQRKLLERRRDQQMAMLYDVTRTVTATLELQQVLWLVCASVLRALDVARLWLFWREAPGGELRALRAEGAGDDASVRELAGDPAHWEALLRADAEPAPEVVAPAAAETAALAATDTLPVRVLRLPLVFQSEFVGIILAECGTQAPEASFLDFAATLGNSAAMAIANARLHALVLQHRAELQQISNKRLDVVEESIRRLSRELHDGTCQALMAIKLDLSLLERQLPSEPAGLHAAVRDIRAQVVDVVHGVRQMSHLLRPPVLDDFGALAAIESVAEKYRAASELHIRVESPDAGARFLPAIELLIFRVFQETLINIAKHADATHVHVRLAVEEGSVVLEISDDGQGFDAHAYFRTPPASAGLGLIGMRERVAHFGGVFRVSSRPGAGTRIFVSLPAEPLAPAALAAAL
jgi:signal transduction histidine kinase